MNIKIDRFEPKEVRKHGTVNIENMNTILIKDHKDDNIISFIQLFNDKKKNRAVAEEIIKTIEDFLLENEDVPENQD